MDVKMRPMKPVVNFAVGDKVFAKVRGYPAWPARIEEIVDARGGPKYKVFFYGRYEPANSAIVKKDEVWLFNDETKAKYQRMAKYGNHIKPMNFGQAMHDIEANPDINAYTLVPTKEQWDKTVGCRDDKVFNNNDDKSRGPTRAFFLDM